MIAQVIINLSLDKAFDYEIPEKLEKQILPGMKVLVPFGRSTRDGYVVDIVAESDFPSLKEIIDVNTSHLPIPVPLMEIGKWMAEYYCCSKEKAIISLLPGAVRSGKVKTKFFTYYKVSDNDTAKKYIEENGKRNKAKARVLQTLLHYLELSSTQLQKHADTSKSVINLLVKDGLVVEEKREVQRDPFEGSQIIKDTPLKPTEEQLVALEQIYEVIDRQNETCDLCKKKEPHTVLLHGVTGSGKTEVYLQAITKILEQGKETIVLVPEISLTPQTVQRFRARFGNLVSVLHSSLSDGERFDEWTKIAKGEVKITVGARSALFAPFKNLGLIIVDEEHENSYKQDESPRYNARDVAVMRGYKEKATVILGSATPSFESYYNALNKKYILSTLKTRVDDGFMPKIKVIDMKQERALNSEGGVFSKELIYAIRDRLASREQVILFLNKRGFAKQMQCEECGFIATCATCARDEDHPVSFTYHRERETLSCHSCGLIIAAYANCPECQSSKIRYPGLGTEKIERLAKGIFQGARVKRMDSDTMTKMSLYEDTLDEFKQGKIDILIGTQMIAKGLHFPKVTLVGIMYADMSLFSPDFRAWEKTFQLVTQVAGRAGRGEIKGEVILQTYSPYNPAILCAKEHDFEAFYEEDIEVREQLLYPPMARLIVVHFRGENEPQLLQFIETFNKQIAPYLNDDIMVSPASPSPNSKIKGKFRYMTMYRGENITNLRQALRHYALHLKKSKNIDVYIDVDAINLM